MSRGELDDATLAMISEQLPSIEELDRTVIDFSPEFISMQCAPDSTIPDAAICLQDTINTLAEARYALHEALAHRIWYLEKAKEKNEIGAVFFGRFYLDDVALRVYSAGEHLAEAIVDMLEIRKAELLPYEEKRISRQTIVGHFLCDKKPTHPITAAISKLANSPEWKATRAYRNDWVHSQPPLLRGLGIAYRHHKQRWQISDDGKHRELHFGGGDEPEYSVEDLLGFIQPTLSRFIKTCSDVVRFYVGIFQGHK